MSAPEGMPGAGVRRGEDGNEGRIVREEDDGIIGRGGGGRGEGRGREGRRREGGVERKRWEGGKKNKTVSFHHRCTKIPYNMSRINTSFTPPLPLPS